MLNFQETDRLLPSLSHTTSSINSSFLSQNKQLTHRFLHLHQQPTAPSMASLEKKKYRNFLVPKFHHCELKWGGTYRGHESESAPSRLKINAKKKGVDFETWWMLPCSAAQSTVPDVLSVGRGEEEKA
ncbi:hypothetical protein SAY87_028867 [Trapa incisa]|uniref:Uncharacterized protein n=1 Tax=Trapa incisa TaxID=236973 RepID=A0AAN7KPX6_9MYRT|nr:hypothetical protein SAY87_028867 [Trapa incisa]